MKKKSIVGRLTITLFVLLGIGCFAFCKWNHVLVYYGLGAFLVAIALIKSDDND